MKTILQALCDQLGSNYSLLGKGLVENALMKRNLVAEDFVVAEVLNHPRFIGAYADCLFELLDKANFSESDISISLADRNLILKKANSLYRAIGEEERNLDQPIVRIGPPPGIYVSH